MNSSMQRSFGASIRVTPASGPDRQVFLVTGDQSRNLAAIVKPKGGTVLAEGPKWVLAELGFLQAMSLRGIPGVRNVAGVSIDPERLEALNRLAGSDSLRR